MSITTKTGDKGKTSLLWGGRVSKDSIRIELCGMLDGLCSNLGVPKALMKNRKERDLLRAIQRDLFVIGAEVSTKPDCIKRLKERVDKNFTTRLEREITRLERGKRFAECCFYLPGESLLSAALDVARTVTRAGEREMGTVKRG